MAAPFILAIDPATSSGFCYGHAGTKPTLFAKRFSGKTDDKQYGAATAFLAGFLMTHKPDLVCIEAPIHASGGFTNAATVQMTNRLYGALVGVVGAKGIPFEPAKIGTWRKWFLGRGNLKGPEAKRQCVALCAQLGWQAPDHNAAEAAGIWSWAASQVDPRSVQRIEPLFAEAAE